MKNRPVIVGFDFDGVIAYNPARLIRAPVSVFKRRILGVKKLSFFYPKTSFEKAVWKLVHNSSFFPGGGIELFKKMVEEEKIEAHLITARYGYLDSHLTSWLEKFGLTRYFSSINMNVNNEQPHIYKENTIRRLKLKYFVEDNWDIVNHLESKFKNQNSKVQTNVMWIYNIIDTWFTPYQNKFPNIGKAVEKIIEMENKVKSQKSKI